MKKENTPQDHRFKIPQDILEKIREYRKEVGRNPISDEVKAEMESWFSENYNGKLDLMKIHNTVMNRRIKLVEELKKEDPLSHVKFKPMILCYKDEIIEVYGEPNSK